MIGSFWNLCRACPSMPVDKLHSEYRSTYRWHEYRGGNKPANGVIPGDATQTATTTAALQPTGVEAAFGGGAPVIRRAPLPSQNATGPRAPSIEPAMPRRKKYPGVAYKTNELFDGPPAGLPSGAIREGSYTLDRARSMERSKYLANKGERRSKSEGPRNALPNGPRNWTDTVEEKATSPSIAEKLCVSSEYRNQFAWPREEAEASADSVGQPKKSASMGALKAAQQAAAKKRPGEGGPTELEPLMNHTDDDDDKKRYIEDYMKDADHPQPAPRRSTFRNAIASFRRSTAEQKEQTKAKGYKSEYKKKFRPFSHYVYEASKGTFTKRRVAKKEDAVDGGAGGTRGAGPPPESKAPAPTPQQDEMKSIANAGIDESWYREVLDLRKRAGEYKCRGWGTETAPDHLTELYSKQMDVWYQVSRRSSLSALSLASANHRVIGKEEKESESRRTSPSKKPKSFRMAPHQSANAKLNDFRTETPAQRAQRRKLQGHSFDNTSMSEGRTGRSSARTSPRKQLNLVIGGRGASVEPTIGDHKPFYRSPKRRPRSADPKPLSNGPLEERRRPSKPSGLALKKYAPSDDSGDGKSTIKQTPSLSGSPKRKANRKVGILLDDDVIPLRTGSAFRDHRGALLDDSPVVKSPPEPTRVKSPEQMNMRSPDPVNWTVPLDTGKTFTVSQTVKSDDLIRRPGSDFRGKWDGDDPHSASLSAPLDHTESSLKRQYVPQQQMPSTSQQDLPTVHISVAKSDNTKLTPPKTVEFQQQPIKTSGKLHAKTPTSPPSSLTPIDETKVLDLATKTPIVNGGTESNSETYSSPVTEHRKSIVSPTSNEPRKSLTSPNSEQRKSITSPIEQKKSTTPSPVEQKKSITSPIEHRKSITSPVEQKKSTTPSPVEQKKSTTPSPVEQKKSTTPSPVEQKKSTTPSPVEQKKSTTPSPVEQKKSTTPSPVEQKKLLFSPTSDGEAKTVIAEQPKSSTTPVRLDDPSFDVASIIKSTESGLNNNNTFKPTEATQKSHGVVDTAVVLQPSQASIAADVLERARTRFDQFWGKKEGNDSV